jgi:hypothetical protein
MKNFMKIVIIFLYAFLAVPFGGYAMEFFGDEPKWPFLTSDESEFGSRGRTTVSALAQQKSNLFNWVDDAPGRCSSLTWPSDVVMGLHEGESSGTPTISAKSSTCVIDFASMAGQDAFCSRDFSSLDSSGDFPISPLFEHCSSVIEADFSGDTGDKCLISVMYRFLKILFELDVHDTEVRSIITRKIVYILQSWYHSPVKSIGCVDKTPFRSGEDKFFGISLRTLVDCLLLSSANLPAPVFVILRALFYLKKVLMRTNRANLFVPFNIRGLFFIAVVVAYDSLAEENGAFDRTIIFWRDFLNRICGKHVYSADDISIKKINFLDNLLGEFYISPMNMVTFLDEIFDLHTIQDLLRLRSNKRRR